jgi:Bacterial Ig-like domain (group 3)
MRTSIKRGFAATAVVALSGALLLGIAPGAWAFDAGPLASVVNNNSGLTTGTNFDSIRFVAPAPCDAAATRHTVKITGVTATSPANQAAADLWVGDLLYSPIAVGLPGPITSSSNGSMQQIADAFGQLLVPGDYRLILQCQNNLGTTIFEQWSGGITFTSPTAWTADSLAAPKVATTTTVTAAPQPVTAGQNVTLTATVNETNAATPTGTVQFFNGATSLGTAPVDGTGVATLVGPLAAGTYNVTGVYSGDAIFDTSTGAATPGFVVAGAPAATTATTLTVAPTTGPAFQSVTAQGTVSNTSTPAVIPVGSCRFLDGAALLGTSAVNATGVCTFISTSFSGPGHSFRVDFVATDPALFAPSTSNIVTATYDSPQFTPDDQTVVVTVPVGSLTIFTPYTPTNPLDLGNMVLSPDGTSFSATAPFNKVTVTDTRAGNAGWSASLTRTDFLGANPANTIPAKFSGFEGVTPNFLPGNSITNISVTDLPANSPTFVPGPATFATAAAGQGFGSVDITANFVLRGVPTSTAPGLYTATVTFTIA